MVYWNLEQNAQPHLQASPVFTMLWRKTNVSSTASFKTMDEIDDEIELISYRIFQIQFRHMPVTSIWLMCLLISGKRQKTELEVF